MTQGLRDPWLRSNFLSKLVSIWILDNKKTRKNDLGTFLSFYIEQYVTPYNRGDPAKPSSLGKKSNIQPNLKMGETQIMLG